ncbi:MAG: hypothetical protein WCC59_08530, partial [Terriglobales bacterium]
MLSDTVTVAVSDLLGSATEVAVTVTVETGTVAGAVYRPVVLMVPHPLPEQPLPEILHVTSALELPATVAVNCWVADTLTVAVFGDTVTDTGTSVTVAESHLLVSAIEVAVRETVMSFAIEEGAAYRPFASTVPQAAPAQLLPETVQVTL